MIACHPFVLVPVKATKFALPEEQIATFIKEYMERAGVKPENFFFDGRGSLAVALARIWSSKVETVEFGGRCTERPVSNDTYLWDGDKRTRRLQTCYEAYNKFVTELWFAVYMVIISDQLRGLPQDVSRELCRRQLTTKTVQNGKVEIETKEDMKLRTGESPDLADCYSGDTLISTERGLIPIEDIQLGDMVKTPFGASPVIARHVSPVTDVTCVRFSNGSNLIGKSKHKVFTWENGWVQMSDLSLTNTNESEHDLPLWDYLDSLFTRVENTGFKALVDTIRTGTIMRLRDFFIELSGRSTLVVFLKVFASITKTAIGVMIDRVIWSLCRSALTCRIIFENVSKTRNIEETTLSNWLTLEWAQVCGTNPRKEESGTASIPNVRGLMAKLQRAWRFVQNAGRHLNHSITTAVPFMSVLSDVRGNDIGEFTMILRRVALCVAQNLWHTGSIRQKPVPLTVERFSVTVPVKMYNLTLMEHNVYYANGILVENCMVTMVEGARRRGFQIMRLPGAEELEADNGWKIDLALRAKRLRQSYTLQH